MKSTAFETLIQGNIRELSRAKALSEKQAEKGVFRNLFEISLYLLAIVSATTMLWILKLAKRCS